MIASKERIHKLIDELPEEEVPVAEKFLRYLCDTGNDPIKRALMNAPDDDEVITPKEEEMVNEAKAAYKRGEVLTEEELVQTSMGGFKR